MSVGLEGKVVVVTGAGGGLGRAVALEMAKNGCKVVVNDLGVSLGGDKLDTEKPPADVVVDEIKAAGGDAVANPDSVSDPAGAKRIIEAAMDAFGRLDGVVNNAGNLRDRIFHKMELEEWAQVIDVHLNGSFLVSRAAAERFRAQESGAFVHMTSTSGLIGNFGQANYAAAKLGIVGLSKTIALDMARYNVRSNCIAPFAWSRMTDSIPAETPEQKARVEKLKKMEAGKVAPLAAYLLSDRAAGINAQIFGARANELMIFNQPRPVRSVHHDGGWTPELIDEIAMPAFEDWLTPVNRSPEVISWDPI